jgi:hypothetical protein
VSLRYAEAAVAGVATVLRGVLPRENSDRTFYSRIKAFIHA